MEMSWESSSICLPSLQIHEICQYQVVSDGVCVSTDKSIRYMLISVFLISRYIYSHKQIFSYSKTT